jgi:hypothetical protein
MAGRPPTPKGPEHPRSKFYLNTEARARQRLKNEISKIRCGLVKDRKAVEKHLVKLLYIERNLAQVLELVGTTTGSTTGDRCAMSIQFSRPGEIYDWRYGMRVLVIRWNDAREARAGRPGPKPVTLAAPITRRQRALIRMLMMDSDLGPGGGGRTTPASDAPRLAPFKRTAHAVAFLASKPRPPGSPPVGYSPHSYTEALRKLGVHLGKYGLGWLIERSRKQGARVRVMCTPGAPHC